MTISKVQVRKSDIEGCTLYDLVFEVSKVLESFSSYEVVKNFNKNVLNCKSDIERLNVINSHITLI